MKLEVMVDGKPVAVADVVDIDYGSMKNDSTKTVTCIAKRIPVGNERSWTPFVEPERPSNFSGIKVDAVIFDEVCEGSPKPCMDCGFPTDQQNSQTIIDGEVRYKCDECEAKFDERGNDINRESEE